MAKVIWRPLPGSQTFFMSCPADIILFHGSRGPGKRLINKAKLLTDSGWKEVGEVVLTDKLVAPDGTYTQILGIYPQESGAMYRMTFDDGCHIDCDGDHRWKVYNGKSMYWTVKTTNQLIGSKTFKHIPLIDKPVPGPKWQGYDPYIIGLMIGDGTMKGANPTIYNPEEPIKDYLVSKGWTCKKYPYRSVYQIYLNGQDEAKALIGAPIAKGDQKHVPAELLMADPNARLAVLQGLMDSDGHCDKEGRCEFKSVSEQLATNVQYLARSLGGKAKVHRQEITKPRLGERDHIFRVKITHAGKFVMFRLQRHIERLNRKQHGDKRRIVSIDKIEDAPATCFEVEHPSHLFVCQDFIVTHNTDAQLMRFFSRVGQGYGKYWRGVIFDREYKNLDDLIAKSERWFPEINPQSRFLRSAGDYKWKWPTGEELLFRAISKPKDYWAYHGQEFCLVEGEKVKTPEGDRAIETLRVGDLVCTPTGVKPVTRVFPPQLRSCVNTSFYDRDWRLISQQQSSADHHLLTSDGDFSRVSLDSFQSVWLSESLIRQNKRGPKFRADNRPKNAENYEHLSSEGNFEQAYCEMRRNELLVFLRSLCQQAVLLRFCQCGINQPLTIRFCARCKFSEPSEMCKEAYSLRRLDQRRLFSLTQPTPSREFLNWNVLLAYAGVVIREALSFCNHYAFDSCLYDGHAQKDTRNDRYFPQLPPYDKECGRANSSDDSEDELSYTRPARLKFWHPYQADKLVETNFLVRQCLAYSTPIGIKKTYDITVGDDNCYISSAGVINKNCFIGWNELGKYPDPELFDAMMSCNRSSFIPQYEQKEIPLEIIATANPYGVGHNWIKKRFINVTRPGEILHRSVKVFNPRNQKEEVFTRTQCHIFGSYKENIFLSPSYIVELESIEDPNKRKAWLKGSWDVTSGGMFDDIWERNIHVVEKFPIPKTWKIDRSFDWGASKPFSVGWWAESDGSDLTLPGGKTISTIKGDLYRIGEWYGTSGKTNQGVNMLAPDIAKGIIARERLLGIENRVQPGPADNSVFDSYNGNNIASEMESPIIMDGIVVPGVSWSRSDKKAGSRKVGWQKIRQYLSDAKPGKLKLNDGTVIYTPRNGPGLFIFSDCKHFIDLVPTLPRDEKDPDDVDCWVANTQISTLAGNIPIQNVRVGDYVHTPIGACMVTKSYCCKPSPVVKVFLENGVVLEGTPDHKIFVKDHGLVALGELECGAILPQRNSECLRLKRSFIKGLFIEDTRTGIITPQDKASLKGGVLHYIDKFTSIISGPFLKNTTSIIKTAIMKTIQRTAVTTKFCHLQSMPVCITRKEADSIIHGQEPRKGKEFFERMPTKCWKISRNENFRAEIVAELLRQNIPRKYIAPHVRPKRMQKDTARNRAKFAEQNSSLEDMQPGKSELAVIRVDGRCEEKATYNLTVKDAALFYANGILSSNTDAEDHIGDEARYRVLDSGRELSSGSIDGSH